MNRGRGILRTRIGGYTILETMIFLAVSALMFLTALQFVSGQTNKTNFVSTVRDFETRLTDMANDISTGYYQNGNTFSCVKSVNRPEIVAFDGVDGKNGANKECIFVGTVLKFGTGGDRTQIVQYTVAGLRVDTSGIPVTSLADAVPIISANTAFSAYTQKEIGYGVKVECVKIGSSCNPLAVDADKNAAFGFFSKLGNTSTRGGNTIQTDLISYQAPSILESLALDQTKVNAASYDDAYLHVDDADVTNDLLNPKGGITICLKSGGTKQYALIHVGGKGNNLTISNEIKSYSGGTPSCA